MDRKENYTIILTKKKVNLNADVLNEQFIKINEKQKELEVKLEKKNWWNKFNSTKTIQITRGVQSKNERNWRN